MAHTHQHVPAQPHAQPHAQDPQHGRPRGDDSVQAELLDLDAEVLAEHIAAIVGRLPLASAPGQIVDLGCGTGTGTFALLERFPETHVTAVDAAPGHLQRLRDKTCARGQADRVRTVQADLDQPDWPDLGSPGLVWASASMHHMADPRRALRKVRELLAPGGLFAVVELAGFPRFLPEGAPEDRPGLEERCHAAADRFHAEHVPHRGSDWGPMLAAAGFAVEEKRTVAVRIEGSGSAAIGRYALGSLRALRSTAAEALAAEDLAALDRLLDADSPQAITGRGDLVVRTERTVWAARRD